MIEITVTTKPHGLADWPVFKAFLDEAARRADAGEIDPRGGVYWLAWKDRKPVAAVLAFLTVEKEGEMALIGGRGMKDWIDPLEWMICEWFRREGMEKATAAGRAGWQRIVGNLGWHLVGDEDGAIRFEKVL